MITNAELNQYYSDLLIIQYKGQEKAPQHMFAVCDALMIYELIDAVENGFSIDTAVGKQLDIIGKYLGVDRIIRGIPFNRDYFGFMKYGENPALAVYKPFMKYSTTPPDTQFLRYGETQDVLKLNDEEFRTILKFRVIQANSQYSLKEIDDALFEAFGTDIFVVDNEDRSVEYVFPTQDTRLATILQSEGLLPKPMGVSVTISFQ